MENSLHMIKEESHIMDCEGFQDLNQWCSAKSAGSPQSPLCTDIEDCYLQENLGTERNRELMYYGLFEENIDGITKEEREDVLAHPFVIDVNDNALMDEYDNPNNIILYVNNQSTDTSPEMSNSDFHSDHFVTEIEISEESPSETIPLNQWELNATSDVLLQGVDSRNVMLSSTSDFNSALYRNMQITNLQDERHLLPASDEIKCNVEMSSTKIHENNAAVIDTIIINAPTTNEILKIPRVPNKNKLMLKLNTSNVNCGNNNVVIGTPDVLRTVEQLENERLMRSRSAATYEMEPAVATAPPDFSSGQNSLISVDDFTPPVTPAKPTKKRTRRDSEDTDATYNPENDYPQTIKRKRKSSPPRISFITRKFLDQFNTPAKRGRPSKRRDSISSNGTNNYDDNCSAVSSEGKYRDQRERNNEASRRSRFNKKLKDIQMEEMAVELEERNKYLRIEEGKLARKRDLLKNYLFNSISNNKLSFPIK